MLGLLDKKIRSQVVYIIQNIEHPSNIMLIYTIFKGNTMTLYHSDPIQDHQLIATSASPCICLSLLAQFVREGVGGNVAGTFIFLHVPANVVCGPDIHNIQPRSANLILAAIGVGIVRL